jgi:prophage regulatory protein
MQTNPPAIEEPRTRRPTEPQPTGAAHAPGALLKIETVCSIRGVRRTKVYDDMQAGLWPRPIKLSTRCARWVASEVVAINQARIAGQGDDQIRELVKRLVAARGLAGMRV